MAADCLPEIPILYSKDVSFRSFLLLVLRRIAFLPHGLTTHLDAMSIVNQTVEDAVSDGGIADLLVAFDNLIWPHRDTHIWPHL